MFLARLLFLYSIFSVSLFASAQDLDGQGSAVAYDLYVLPDVESELTCAKMGGVPEARWEKHAPANLHLGFSSHPYWLRIKAKRAKSIDTSLFVIFQHDLLESVERCVTTGTPQKAGIHVPFAQWPLHVSVPAFEIKQNRIDKYIYFKIESRSILNFPVKVFDLSGYVSFLHNRQNFQYGLLAFAALVSLFYFLFFLVNKQVIYFYFSLLATGTGVCFYILYGDGYMYFWPDSPDMQWTGIKASSALTSLLSTLFGRHLLNTWKLPKVDRWFQAMIGLASFHFIISFMPSLHHLYEFILVSTGFVGIPLVLTTSYLQYRRNHYFIKYYLMGWVLVLVSFKLSVLASTGVKPYHDFLYYAPVMAYPFGLVFFMVGSYSWVVTRNEEVKVIQERHDRILETFRSLESGEVRNSKTQLTGVDINKSLQLLSKLMREERLYELEDLRLETLALHMDLRPHQLSELLNKELQISFADFLQKTRVEAAKDQLSNPDNTNSILDIGLSVGFGSKTSFNRGFVRTEGVPPGQYRKLMNSPKLTTSKT